MNKKEVIGEMSKKVIGSTQKEAEKFLNAFFEIVKESLKKGEEVRFVGFGTFVVKERAARTGINLKTKEKIKVPAKKVVKLKVGKNLADSVL